MDNPVEENEPTFTVTNFMGTVIGSKVELTNQTHIQLHAAFAAY